MRCTAKNKQGNRCGLTPVPGASVCWRHGGRAPQVQRKAIVVAELQAWGLADTAEDPGEVLLRLVTQSSRRAAFYAGLLEQQYAAQASADDPDGTTTLPAGVGALIGHKMGMGGKDGILYTVEEAIRGLVQLEAMERDRCARFAKLALDAGIQERQVRLAERQGALIVEILRAVLADPELGLTAEQRKAVPGVARRHLAIA
jgi:hypothetical protein